MTPPPDLRRSPRAARPLFVALAALVASTGCQDDSPDFPRPEQRLLVVGWDGASFDLVDPLIEAGRLPNLAGLMERGTSARLESTIVPISSAAWCGAVTGKGPGQTGVYSFFSPLEKSYDVELVSSLSNRATPLWRILTMHGLRANVIGVPVTYPPERVFGTMVAGMLSPFGADYAHPPGYADELRARGFEPDLGTWREHRSLTTEHVSRQLQLKEELVLEHVARDDWDFTMVVFKSLDVMSHRAYGDGFDSMIVPIYVELDAILGKMLAAAGPDTNVIVLSDHGFRSYTHAFNLHAWLIELGFGVERPEATPTEPNTGPLADTRAADHRARIAALDLGRTRAFASACEGNFGSIRVNVAGREPKGCVDRAGLDALLMEISSQLLTTTAGPEGPPLVRRTLRARELYPGPHADVVPDLLFEVSDEVQVIARRGGLSFGAYQRAIPDHALHGIFVAAGPAVRQSHERAEVGILDLAPTALHLLNQPVYREMQGAVRTELLERGRDPRWIREDEDPALRLLPARAGRPFTSEELEELTRRLDALGYGN